jgi:hypothetical protein
MAKFFYKKENLRNKILSIKKKKNQLKLKIIIIK